MSESLYALAQEFVNAEAAMEEAELDPQTIKDTLDGIELGIEEKVRQITRWIKNTDSLITSIKKEEESMKARRQSMEKRNERLKEYIAVNMRLIDRKAYEYPEFKVSLRKTQSVGVADFEKIPTEYLRYKPAPAPEPDKVKILKALKEGELVAGTELVNRDTIYIK